MDPLSFLAGLVVGGCIGVLLALGGVVGLVNVIP